MNKNENNENRMQDLANMLRAAQGERSLREYAEASGVSASNLSRIINCKTAKMPSRQMLERLASEKAAPRNGITLEDLLVVAGYKREYDFNLQTAIQNSTISDKNIADSTNKLYLFQYNNVLNNTSDLLKRYESIASGALVNWLIYKNKKFTVLGQNQNYKPPKSIRYFIDLCIELSDQTEITYWNIDFLFASHSRISIYDKSLYPRIGRLAMSLTRPDEKYSIVTNSVQFVEELRKAALSCSLNANFSIILVDIETAKVIEELIISYAI